MEAAILVGLIGAGLMLNKDDSTPVQDNVNKEINFPSMDNAYESNYYDQTQKTIKELAEKNFNESNQPGNTINFQKTKHHLYGIIKSNENFSTGEYLSLQTIQTIENSEEIYTVICSKTPYDWTLIPDKYYQPEKYVTEVS